MPLTSLHQQGMGRNHVHVFIPRVQPWVIFLSLHSDLNTLGHICAERHRIVQGRRRTVCAREMWDWSLVRETASPAGTCSTVGFNKGKMEKHRGNPEGVRVAEAENTSKSITRQHSINADN